MKELYRKLYEKNRAFLEKHTGLKRVVLFVNAYLPYLFVIAYLVFCGVALLGKDIEANELAKFFYLPAIALLLVSVLQLAISRPRPYQEEGGGIIPLQSKKSRFNSMPSRHMTSAGVIAVCFLPLALPVGVLLLFCSLLLGYCRFAVGWHYPSDLGVGLLLGVFIGCGTFLW